MRRFFLLSLLAGVALAGLLAGCSDQSSQVTAPVQQQFATRAPLLAKVPGGNYVPGSYIIVLKESVADVDGEVNQIGQQFGFTADYRYRYAIKGFAGTLSPAVVEALRNNPNVAYIEQDQIAHIVATQANPPSWGLDRIDQRALPLDAAYVYNQAGAGVDVYIIDTGIRVTHNDFGGRAVAGYDAITPGGTADDANGHGTHVSGTVGGTTYGVAKGVRLIAVRVLNASGSGTYSQVIAGVDWVTSDHTTRPAVANMSLGGPVSTALDDAVRKSIADGVTYCVAAGNSAVDASTQSPADVAEAITVGATGSTDAFAYFSNYGPIVDISAPGISITSDWNTSNTATNTISGTSMATPHVAGAAALYLEANSTATPAAVSSALVANATGNVISGLPSGTANKLLYSLPGAPPPPPPPPVAPTLSAPADSATGVAVPATLSWNASTGATSYTCQVSTSAAFTMFAYNVSGITGTSTVVSGLAANTIYFWRVNAANAGGPSTWSAVWSFTTAAGAPSPPSTPTLISPANGSSNVPGTATLSWNASTGASTYRVQISTNSNFRILVDDKPGITSTSTTVPGLRAKTRYFWRVNATNANGTSAWSTTWNFRAAR